MYVGGFINILSKNIEEYRVDLRKKLDDLEGQLKQYLKEGMIVAFSGGVDSAFLLWAAKEILIIEGGKLLAVTAHSPSLPKLDLNDARLLAETFGVTHKVIESHETELPEYIRNDLLRCYYCRKEMFRLSGDVAKNEGYQYTIYGYNATDKDDFRPGHKAALENGILSPLAQVSLTKDEIRYTLRANNIEISDKPSSPCLSSRIMTDIPITEKRLRDVEDMENIIRDSGISIFRVRLCEEKGDDFFRIETEKENMLKIIEIKETLVNESLKRGYRWITLDLAGYKMGGGNRE